jgi:hypothetical protein
MRTEDEDRVGAGCAKSAGGDAGNATGPNTTGGHAHAHTNSGADAGRARGGNATDWRAR